jgi:hypothetical protein
MDREPAGYASIKNRRTEAMDDSRYKPMGDPDDAAQIDAAVLRVLSTPPRVAVPADFAARVRRALPAQKPSRSAFRPARSAAIAASIATLAAVFYLASHAAPSFTSLPFDMELLLLLELAGIMTWVARMQQGE